MQIYFDATESHGKQPKTQVAILLNLLGTDGFKVYNTLKVSTETVFEILKVLEACCIPRKNQIMEHYKFFTRKQGIDESFETFYTDLRELAKSCDLSTCEEKLLRSQIVLGISNKDVQTSLLREDYSLDKIVKHCRAVEQTEVNRKLVQEDNTKLLFNIETNRGDAKDKNCSTSQESTKNGSSRKDYNNKFVKNKYINKNNILNVKNEKVYVIDECMRCGKLQKINECPGYSKKCGNCGKLNHFKIKCRRNIEDKPRRQVDNIEIEKYVTLDVIECNTLENNRKSHGLIKS